MTDPEKRNLKVGDRVRVVSTVRPDDGWGVVVEPPTRNKHGEDTVRVYYGITYDCPFVEVLEARIARYEEPAQVQKLESFF